MRLLRLQGRKVCDLVLRKGMQWKGTHLSARFLLGHPRHPSARLAAPAIYGGTFASAKLDKSAVRRNRMRRRCREALRRELAETQRILPAVQLLLCPRSSSLDSPFPLLTADIRRLLSFLATCQKPSPPVRAS